MRPRENLLTENSMNCMFVLMNLLIQGKSFTTANSSWKLRQEITIYALAIFLTRHQSPEATLNFQYIAIWDSRESLLQSADTRYPLICRATFWRVPEQLSFKNYFNPLPAIRRVVYIILLFFVDIPDILA